MLEGYARDYRDLGCGDVYYDIEEADFSGSGVDPFFSGVGVSTRLSLLADASALRCRAALSLGQSGSGRAARQRQPGGCEMVENPNLLFALAVFARRCA